VLDLETTGLDPALDSIIQVGLVLVVDGAVDLASAWESPVALPVGGSLDPRSVTIHGLLEQDLRGADSLATVLEELARRSQGCGLVAHMGSTLDRPFLDRALGRLWGLASPDCWLDTARLAAWFDDNRTVEVPPPRAHGLARLPDLLRRYGLPRGQEHSALGDAISAAQLFLVLATKAEALGLGGVGQLRKLG
jgi:DNA polymerase-3 subunit epsilon